MNSPAAVHSAPSLATAPSPLLRGADLALLLVAIVWGTSYGVAKGALAFYPVLGFLAVRFLLTTALLAPVALRGTTAPSICSRLMTKRWRNKGRTSG